MFLDPTCRRLECPRRVCGRTEAQLTDLGRAQAAQVGEEAARAGVNVILASPMDRAQETAAIIAQKVGVPVLTEPLLIEQDFGTFEGRSVDDPEYREKRKSLLWHYPQGESTAQLIHRAYTVIEKVPGCVPGQTGAAGVPRLLRRAARTYFVDIPFGDFYEFYMENCQLLEFDL